MKRLGAISALLLFGLGSAFANDAIVLLNQMNKALHELHYEGKLVFVKEGEVSTLSVFHHLENGAEKEVIVPLDSNGDEFIRDSQSFSLSNLPPQITEDMKAVYSFDMGEMSRVAGRPCRIVLARPKDRKRYLQKFCIDREYSLLLKYSLINQRRQHVERFMFTDIRIIPVAKEAAEVVHTPAASVATSGIPEAARSLSAMPLNTLLDVDEEGMSEATDNDAELADALLQGVELQQTSSWFFDPLPAGFKLLHSPRSNILDAEEHIVLSDGLSSVSVFIGEGGASANEHQAIQSGALNILTRKKNNYSITLVGEVPRETLQEIFTGLRYSQ